MNATAATVDAAIYTVEPPYVKDYDWPALPYRAPVNVPTIAKKARKPRPLIRVVNLDGVVRPATDTTLATVLQPRIEVVKPAITNHDVAKIKGGFAVPYFNQVALVVPMGQRKLVPTSCWYRAMTNAQDTDGDTFWYRFEVMPGVIVGYSEKTLKKLNGVGE